MLLGSASGTSSRRGPDPARAALLPIGESPAMREVLAAAEDVAVATTTVLMSTASSPDGIGAAAGSVVPFVA